MIAKRPPTRGLSLAVGLAALAFSVLYLASDLVELIEGGFSTRQLALTLVAEAAIPLFVVGLFALQRPRIGTLGLVGTVVYASHLRLLHGHGVVRARERDEQLGRARGAAGDVDDHPRCLDDPLGLGHRAGGRPCARAPSMDGIRADDRHGPDRSVVCASRCRPDGVLWHPRRGVRWDGRVPAHRPPAWEPKSSERFGPGRRVRG